MFAVVVVAVLGQISLVHGFSGISLSLRKPTYASTDAIGRKHKVVDGDTNGDFSLQSCWETDIGDMEPYWMVDLQGMFPVTHVAITNRANCCPERLHDIEIKLYSENPIDNPEAAPTQCSFFPGPVGDGVTQVIPCSHGTVTGRFVKLYGRERIDSDDRFTLCEVSVLHMTTVSKRENLAKGKPSFASSGIEWRIPTVVDGNANSTFRAGSCWESRPGDEDPYWMVDLQQEYQVGSVSVTNRGDCCGERLHDIEIVLYSENPIDNPEAARTLCSFFPGPVGDGVTQVIPCSKNVNARFVKMNGLKRKYRDDLFTLCEVSVSSGKCLSAKFIPMKNMRVTGTLEILDNISRIECVHACSHNFYCVGFNYGGGSTCETVTVTETAVEASGWSFYSLAYVDP